jgi:ElaB/YqjD/DUF883 family membrane-anchored ribosome-binding protein
MDHESEVIRHQMEETRTALTDKLELLEQQVVETVEGASTAVAETVESVKEVVQETVQTVKDSVQESVEAVKHALDLKGQVDRRPWTMLAGATALGFLGGYLLRGRRAGRVGEKATEPAGRAPRAASHQGVPESHHSGGSNAARNGIGSATAGPGLLANLGDTFQAEISQLKGLAVATLLGIVRDLVTQSVPEPMERQVEDVMNGITVKLGGQPIHGRLLREGSGRERVGKLGSQEDPEGRERSDPHTFSPGVLKRA